MLFVTKFLLVSIYQEAKSVLSTYTFHWPASITVTELYLNVTASFRYLCCDLETSFHLLQLSYTISLAQFTRTISDTCL
jgi:hypothetical protein